MPKIIENLHEQILSEGKKILMEEGYEALTMRRTAECCSIAVGTVYNYYKSKEMLVARIMLEDWLKALASARKQIETEKDAIECIQILYKEIHRFSAIYFEVWGEYRGTPIGSSDSIMERHHLLISQMSELIRPVIMKGDKDPQPDPCSFISEVVLQMASRRTGSFEEIRPFIQKLL